MRIRVLAVERQEDGAVMMVKVAAIYDDVHYVVVFRRKDGKMKTCEKYPKDAEGNWATVPDEIFKPMTRLAGSIFSKR